MIGTLITGKILNADYRRVKAGHELQLAKTRTRSDGKMTWIATDTDNGFPLEKARLRLVPLFALVQCLSILLFGWTIQFPPKVHIAAQIVSTFMTGWTAVSTPSVIMTYLVDVFHTRSAAASASLNLARCLFAAGGTSFIMPMISGIGVGIAFTVSTAAQFVALLGVAVQWRYGASWRLEADGKRRKAGTE